MYGPDEHRYFLRELERAAREVTDLRSRLGVLRGEMLDDELIATQASRDFVREVSQHLGNCLSLLDNAAVELPTPAAKWVTP